MGSISSLGVSRIYLSCHSYAFVVARVRIPFNDTYCACSGSEEGGFRCREMDALLIPFFQNNKMLFFVKSARTIAAK